MGHPLVTVNMVNQTHVSVSQEHFLFSKTTKVQTSEYEYFPSFFFNYIYVLKIEEIKCDCICIYFDKNKQL